MRGRAFLTGMGLTLLQGGVELLLYLPVLVIPAALLMPETPLWRWAGLLPLCYAAGYALNRRFRFQRFYSLWFASLGISILYMLGAYPLTWNNCWLAPLAWLLAYRGGKLAVIPWRIYFQVKWHVLGLLLYFAASICFPYSQALLPYVPLLNWAGLIALFITLATVNLANVRQETLSGDKEPAVASTVLRNNRLLISLLAVMMVAIVWFRKLQQAVNWLKQQLIHVFQWLLNRPAEQTAPEKSPHPAAPLPLSSDRGEPSLWLVWLEKLAYVAAAILIIAAVLYLLYRMGGKLIVLLKHCYQWLTGRLSRKERSQETGYHDEVEQLMNWHMWKAELASRWKQWKETRTERTVKWEDLSDNRERMRFLYRLFLRRCITDGYSYKPELTARETVRDIHTWRPADVEGEVSESLADLYEMARYSDHPIKEEELNWLRQKLTNK